ncbi:hypothetical protein [Emticicia sp. 17c]|uniref:hypothetical protein n=1 Tax=Emticicia sp. 17c TaxID=3127704 RepID=UPI00301DE8C6
MAKTYFAEHISKTTTSLGCLPVFHSCSARAFREILMEKELKAFNCEVFNELLLYFFMVNHHTEKISQVSLII